MNDIISNQEYRELLRASIKKNYMSVLYVMIGVAVFYGLLSIVISVLISEEESFNGLWFLIPGAIFLVIGYVFYHLAKRVDNKNSPHFSYDQFVEYKASGTKIPMYRMVNYGNNSQTIYLLMDLENQEFTIYDHKKKGLKVYKKGNQNNTQFKFYYKSKDGFDIIKKYVDIIIDGRKTRVMGYPQINENMIDICQVEGYQVHIL